jgi:hypothetical protein
MADSYNPTAVKGDTITWAMNLKGPTGAAYDIAGCTLSMQVRKSYHPSGLIVSYVYYIEPGSTFSGIDGVTGGLSAAPNEGMVFVTIGSVYTINFSSYTPSFYDMQLQYPNNGGIATLLRGVIDTLPDVTENK